MDFNKSIEFFYMNVIDTLSNDESDGDSELMKAATTLIHEHSERQRHVHKGLTKAHMGNLKRNRKSWPLPTLQGLLPFYKSYLPRA
jgi:TRAP-type uncharacterized transport system substrate-binding protein